MCIPLTTDAPVVESLAEPWYTAEVKLVNGNMRYEIFNRETLLRYQHEPVRMIAFKCAMLVIGIPFYLFAYSLFHIVRVPFCIVNELSFRTVPYSIWAIVKAPFYAIAFEFACLYGIFKPLEGRALISKVESDWHEKTRKDAIIFLKDSLENVIWNALTHTHYQHTYFLAFCMQTRGPINDQLIYNEVKA
jgi:hypothetical protein